MKKLSKIILIISGFIFLQANEPSWVRYPAISPNGTEIIFSYMGDLYKVSSTGGEAHSLTRHTAHDFMPVWSNDGSKIAFASDRFGNYDIFVMSANGGKPDRITYHSSNDYPSSWHPDDNSILFSSSRMDTYLSTLFPSGRMTELYSATLDGKLPVRLLTSPAEDAIYDDRAREIFYHDRNGLENIWRKHHTSSDTRDIWKYELRSGKHTQLTDFEGEDRSPHLYNKNEIFFLSERFGSFNVWKMKDNGKNVKQVTFHTEHPVRFLSQADNGTICYAFRGDIYILPLEWTEPVKVEVALYADDQENEIEYKTFSSGATEMAVSPDSKEIAFIVRGEVFVTSAEYETTRRITATPEQERNISFSSDGRKLLYAGERNGSWNLYQSSIVNEDDKHFASADEIIETPILVSEPETFQPQFSPNDSLIAYLHERDEIRILDVASGDTWIALPAKNNYSYSDGDQYFEWSPDGKWLVANYLPSPARWVEDIALISVDGKKLIPVTESGYPYWVPHWSEDGSMIYAFSNELGMRSHGSWGSQTDVFGYFTSDSTYDFSKLSKEEVENIENEEEDESENDDDESEKDDDDDEEEDEAEIKPIRIEEENFRDRKQRLTVHSSQLRDGRVSTDGKYLVYLARFEKGFDLWKVDLRERTPSLVAKMGAKNASSLHFDEDGTHVFFLKDGGNIVKYNIESGEMTAVSYHAEMELNYPAERAYMFEHVWRQMKKKFYVEDMHGVDWDMMKSEYSQFLPDINNNRDFCELLSEILGELNASHTGCYYRGRGGENDQTYSLGLYLDSGGSSGILVDEVINNGPSDKHDLKITKGTIIEAIDGNSVTGGVNYHRYLNRIKNRKVRLSLLDSVTGDRWVESIQPVSRGQLFNLVYNRWIENKRVLVDSLSNGRLGYVHVRGMNDSSFRKTFAELFGRQVDKEALIMDTRWNGGGWLHDDLAKLLSGTDYSWAVPRGKQVGKEPQNRWTKPVVLVMGEANYSDAHFFPYAYTALNIGKTVGMPIPGTATAVWWENLLDPSLVFGMPMVGVKNTDGEFLENNQLEPDYRVKNDPESIAKGRDKQIEKAVEVLLEQLD